MRIAKGITGAILALAALGAILFAQAPSAPGAGANFIVVSGLGEVKAKPDMASISAGVVTQAATAAEALAANSQAMNAVIAALKNLGVAEDDIQTSNFSVSPQYPPYDSNNLQPPKIVGYQVSNQVTAIVRDLAKLGTILDGLVQAGANNINGVSFGIDKADALEDEARKAAIADAKHRAEIFAAAAGVSVGRVIAIQEMGTSLPPQPYLAMRAEVAAAVPIATGQETVSASVNVTFELK